jgi:hypothetical protein
LLGVTYSQFDNIVGTKLLYSYPESIILRSDPHTDTQVTLDDVFECLADYVIMGKHLCGKVIAVRTEDVQFVNYSMAIDNPKYERNTLLYSFGFALSVTADIEPFENILRKISYIFLQLEVSENCMWLVDVHLLFVSLLGGPSFCEQDILCLFTITMPHQQLIEFCWMA